MYMYKKKYVLSKSITNVLLIYFVFRKIRKKFLNSISEALKTFGIFNELKHSYNISQFISSTYINIDLYIIKRYFANFPSQDKIREAYLVKNYTRIAIEDLQNNFKIVRKKEFDLIRYLS